MVTAMELETWADKFLCDAIRQRQEAGGTALYPSIRVPKRDGSNNALGEDGVMRLGDKVVEKSLSKTGGRGYAGLLCCISFAHKLLTSGETATMRAMYYYYKGGAWSPWQSQLECNESIADAAALFGVERHELGFKSTPKGFVAGRLRIDDNPSLDDTPQSIGHDWMTKARKIRSNARCILVVEKDGVFQRLVTDRFFDKYPCVLVTGVGVPDMPTRACVSYIQKALGHIPVYLVVDWNPWGLAIVLCYKFGSARLGIESQKYAINQARWLGIREAFPSGCVGVTFRAGSSQVEPLNLPKVCLQPLNENDQKRSSDLLLTPWIKTHPKWAKEIQAQVDSLSKCELEALLLTRMSRISEFLQDALISQDYIE